MSSRRHFIQLMPAAGVMLLAACSKERPVADTATVQPAVRPPAEAPPSAPPSLPQSPAASSAPANADALPMLEEKRPDALKLGYVSDATRADVTTFKTYVPGQACGRCALYRGNSTNLAGPCALFPGARVAAAGWCASFAQKPT